MQEKIKELESENEKLKQRIRELENRHYVDLSVIFALRRQVDFLMEAAENK